MNNLIEKIEQEYRTDKNFGVLFGIDHEDFDTEIIDNIDFLPRTISSNHSIAYIVYNGIKIGFLEEKQRKNYLHPITHKFILFAKNDSLFKDNEHFVEDEDNHLSFATLQSMLDFYLSHMAQIATL